MKKLLFFCALVSMLNSSCTKTSEVPLTGDIEVVISNHNVIGNYYVRIVTEVSYNANKVYPGLQEANVTANGKYYFKNLLSGNYVVVYSYNTFNNDKRIQVIPGQTVSVSQ
jgi:hypothetical protein